MDDDRAVDQTVRRVLGMDKEGPPAKQTDMKRLARYMGRYVRKIPSSGLDNQEFLSECLFRISEWRHKHPENLVNPKALLDQIARNLIVDQIRRRVVRQRRLRELRAQTPELIGGFRREDVPPSQRWVHGFPTYSSEPALELEQFRTWLLDVDADLVAFLDLKLQARRQVPTKGFEKKFALKQGNLTGRQYAAKSERLEEAAARYIMEAGPPSDSAEDE